MIEKTREGEREIIARFMFKIIYFHIFRDHKIQRGDCLYACVRKRTYIEVIPSCRLAKRNLGNPFNGSQADCACDVQFTRACGAFFTIVRPAHDSARYIVEF